MKKSRLKRKLLLVLNLTFVANFLYYTDITYASSNPLETNQNYVKQEYRLDEFDDNEIIVTYKDKIKTTNEVHTLSIDSDAKVEQISETQLLVTASTKETLKEKIDEYASDPNVEYYQPNFTYKILSGADEPYFFEQWWALNNGTFATRNYTSVNLNTVDRNDSNVVVSVPGIDINVSKVWNMFTGTRPMTIAIVDTGVEITHPDLTDVIYTNTQEIPNDNIDNDNNGFIDDVHGWNFYDNNNDVTKSAKKIGENNHGTHLAGIIGAKVNNLGTSGVASNTNTKILPIKVLGGEHGTGKTLSIIQGIKYAEKMGAVVCNLSLGYDENTMTNSNDNMLKRVIKNSNMMFVIAGGNGDATTHKGLNLDSNPIYPAAFDCDNIISVANIRCDGVLDSTSNYGANSVDIAAPGTCILSTITGNTYGYNTGTSMSAPMIAGGLAEIYSYYPDINIRQAARILLQTTKKIPSLSGKVATGGILDIYNSLTTDINSIIPDFDKPVIKTKTIENKNTSKNDLLIKITDKNLKKVCYTITPCTIEDFYHGNLGTELNVINNSATLSNIKSNTTYTIYALDAYDNESILTVPIKTLPTSPKLSATKRTIKVGKNYKLTVKPNKENTVTFSSSNKSIATVSSKGVITAKKKGSCKIYVKLQNGTTAICKITVK